MRQHLPSNPDAALREAVKTGNIVFVAGTGVSTSATFDPATKSGHPQASWIGLLKHGLDKAEKMGQLDSKKAALYRELLEADATTENLISTASTVTKSLGGATSGIFKTWLEETIGNVRATNRDILDALHALREAGNLLATTNYDDVLLDYRCALQPITWIDGDEIIGALKNRELHKIIYLHGNWKRPETVILDGRSYEQIARHDEYRYDLAAFWKTTTWVYVGCSESGITDPDLGLLLERHGERARAANHLDFCLVQNKDLSSFQKRFDEFKLNIVAVSYGDNHSALPSFLRSLLPAPATPALAPKSPLPTAGPTTSIPAPPEFFAKPDYIGRHNFVGRKAQLQVLTDWAKPTDPTSILLFEAIGGNGKSMLTWHWTNDHADAARVGHEPWAGRFWYSFYEKGAIMRDFCLHALHYMTQQAMETLEKKTMADLRTALLAQLHARPWLLILDGLERVLVAYHRIDAAEVRDEEVNRPTDKILDRDPCDAIRDEDTDLLRALAAAKPSKILISSRLIPRVLLNPSGLPLPGVRPLVLPGLDDADAEELFCKVCGIQGTSADIRYYLKTFCDNHPLVIGVLAGLINSPGPHRGHFDTWAAAPEYGAKLDLARLDLIQSRNHILRAAMDALEAPSRQLLSTLALLTDAVDYDTVAAFNPHLPPEPKEVKKPEVPEKQWRWDKKTEKEKAKLREEYDSGLAKRKAYEQALQDWRDSAATREAPKKLGETLQDIESRGLVQYDGGTQRYDLHPVVRGVAAGGMNAEDKKRYGLRVVDHFNAQPHPPYEKARTMDDVASGLHVVRTLLKLEHFDMAAEAYQSGLSQALLHKLEAHEEILRLLKPFFPNGWGSRPVVIYWRANEISLSAALALDLAGENAVALVVYQRSLIDYLQGDYPHPRGISSTVSLIVNNLLRQGHYARAMRMADMALELTGMGFEESRLVSHPEAQVFEGKLDKFAVQIRCEQNERVLDAWLELDWHQRRLNGVSWISRITRRGQLEFLHALWLFWQERIIFSEEQLDGQTEVAWYWATRRDDRPAIRDLHRLRGSWGLEQGQCSKAITSFREAVRMAREVRLVDEESETGLALAKHHLGQLTGDAARSEAERLAGLRQPAHRTLAMLWLALGDHAKAEHHALAAYRWAWADGEPYVHRYELTKTTELLNELGVPIPNLPPYDPAKDEPFPWEADVRAAIEKLKAEKEAEKSED